MAIGLAASLLLLGLACRALLRFQPGAAGPSQRPVDVEEWFFEPSQSAAGVVLLLFGWLVWRRRRRLAALWGRRGPVALSLGLWLAGAGVFAWAVRARAPDLEAFALIPLVLGAVNLLAGTAALRVVAPPAAVLLFAVPLPAPLHNELIWQLQLRTGEITGFLLRLLGDPVRVSGDMLYSKHGTFVIIESCAGLRSIETLTLLAVLMADLFGRRGWHVLALLAAAPFVAFAINGLRALGLVFNPHSGIASVHTFQGIAMLLVGVLVLYAWDSALARWLPRRDPLSAAEIRARRAGSPRARLGPRVAALAGCAGLLLVLSVLPPFAPPARAVAPLTETLAPELDGWSSSALVTDWRFLANARFEVPLVSRRYRRDGEEVDVFLARADVGKRLWSYWSPKTGIPGSGWSVESDGRGEVSGREARLHVLRKGRQRVLAAHWYEGSPGLAAESLRALLALDAAAFRRERVPLVVRLCTPLAGAGARARRTAEERLDRFATLLAPLLEEAGAPPSS